MHSTSMSQRVTIEPSYQCICHCQCIFRKCVLKFIPILKFQLKKHFMITEDIVHNELILTNTFLLQ